MRKFWPVGLITAGLLGVFAAVALANVLLSSHTGELGATWAQHPAAGSTAELTPAGRVRTTTAGVSAIYYASGVPASADYTVEADVYVASQPTSSAAGVAGRMSTTADTYYTCRYSSTAAGWQLFKFVAGTATQLGATSAQTLTTGSSYHVELNMTGSAIACKVDGTTKVSATDSAITAAGRAGIRMHSSSVTDTTGFQLDNFAAKNPFVGDSFTNSASPAADLYVSATGSGTSGCTQAAPCTVARADAIVTAGQSVQVADGTYTAATFTAAGTAGNPVRWIGATKWGARFPYVVVQGNYIDFGAVGLGFDVGNTSSSNVLVSLDGNFTRAIGNHVHDLLLGCGGSGGAGINAEGWQNSGYNGHDISVLNNTVTDIGVGPRDGTCSLDHGIYLSIPFAVAKNNRVERSIGDGITSWHAASNLTITNNTVTESGSNGITLGNGDQGASQMTGSVVNNNLSVHNFYSAIGQCCSGSSFGSNSFTDNTGWSNGISTVVQACPGSCSSTIAGSVNLLSSPFVSYPTNLHPASGSEPIDSGTSVTAPSDDLDGATRPVGAGYDRGAYEG